jgi:pyruvate,water dikinase
MPLLAADFDERDPAVKILLLKAIEACQTQQKYVGICGQGPSDHLDFAKWLVEKGIESISLNPDSVVATWQALAN